MRPFVPPSVFTPGFGGANGNGIAARAEASGWARGREEGFAEGLTAGRAEGDAAARAELEPQLAELERKLSLRDAEAGLADTLRDVLAARNADRLEVDAACRAAMLAALRLIFPALLDKAPGQEIAALLQDSLVERPADTLVVRAQAQTLDRLREALPSLPPGQAERVRLNADPAHPAHAAEIRWQSGGVTYDPSVLLGRIAAALGGAAMPDAARDSMPDSRDEKTARTGRDGSEVLRSAAYDDSREARAGEHAA